MPPKRTRSDDDTLYDDDYFMAVAVLSSKRSKDPKTQVGACVVAADGKVVSIGYNGMPNGCDDDKMPWGKGEHHDHDNDKHTYVCHAEMNAIVNKYVTNYAGCRMYQTLNPCNECAKLIVNSGIKEVYYIDERNKKKFKAASAMMGEAGVRLSKFGTKQEEINLRVGDKVETKQKKSLGEAAYTENDKDSKRTDCLGWEHYYMAMAKLSARRSRDPSTQVGACIVAPDKRIVGLGYNCYPSCNQEKWARKGDDELHTKYFYVGHAAANAVMNRVTSDLTGCTLYTTLFPCNECVKMLIQAGIKNIIYESDEYKADKYKDRLPGAKRMLKMAGVEHSPFNDIIDTEERVNINLSRQLE